MMKVSLAFFAQLLRELREIASRKRRVLRAPVKQSLGQSMAQDRPTPRFRLRKASFKGRGLRADLADAGWDRLRDLAYEGRGS